MFPLFSATKLLERYVLAENDFLPFSSHIPESPVSEAFCVEGFLPSCFVNKDLTSDFSRYTSESTSWKRTQFCFRVINLFFFEGGTNTILTCMMVLWFL